MSRFAILACLALSACASTPVLDIPPVADPCPAEGLAPVRAEPLHPVPDPVEKGRVFGAIAGAIGADRAQALVRFWETDEPTWGRQGWERVKRTKTWCEGRSGTARPPERFPNREAATPPG